MLNDLTEEGLILLKDLPKSRLIGPRRNGGRMNIRTGFCWASKGVCGVILETIVQGGMRYTSEPAIRRFFARVTAAKERKRGCLTVAPNHVNKQDHAEVETELDRLGI